ncbi:MAG: bifunctional glutamate N-acetyltransferase/amino-acid acetyltransferase ArgJ [Planctomycetaceae bacterium]|nr:bifunctional glutamate N-acetyltransferase/amino-acid acetyltransferase ArgJ [Planctomycetaceae bacterium]
MSRDRSPGLPEGFRASGTCCGIKSNASKRDLAIFLSETSCAAAGVFTTNRVSGAPVQVSRKRLPSQKIRGVIINSGNANACTGPEGIATAERMTAELAAQIGCEADQILVCSTGVIGVQLPVEKISQKLPEAVATATGDEAGITSAATAMMTTDTYAKLITRDVDLETGRVTLTGVAKGAAMIAPNMATMLAVIMTDLTLDSDQAENLLPVAVNQSFNCISVDGHTSTSDSVLLLANGKSGVRLKDRGDVAQFQAALMKMCVDLAQMIIRDAEGASHFVTVDVEGARNFEEAEIIAREVANDVLVKTAIAGNDPNWGRIVSACGRTGCLDSEADVSLAINRHAVFKKGKPVAFDESKISASMQTGDVVLDITLTQGEGRWRIWTSDLTTDYVRLNSEYTT